MPPATLNTAAKRALKAQGRTFVWLADKLGIPQYRLSRQLDGRTAIPLEQAQRMHDLTGLPIELFMSKAESEVA